MRSIIACTTFSIVLVSCASKSLNVGSDTGDAGANYNVPEANEGTGGASGVSSCVDAFASNKKYSWPQPDDCVVGDEMADIVGQWEGYFQGSAIGDEASTFRINIVGANSTKGLCGTITFGVHTDPVSLPPATDPTAVYPPGASYSDGLQSSSKIRPVLGLPYTIADGKVDARRVTFKNSYEEIFKSWCALQTAYIWDAACPSYNCLPGGYTFVCDTAQQCSRSDPTSGQVHHYPAAQVDMCVSLRPCDCDATGCVAAIDHYNYTNSFDLVFNGDDATGICTLDTTQNVILHRVSQTPIQ